jgi:type IV pilus assembly protein PilW
MSLSSYRIGDQVARRAFAPLQAGLSLVELMVAVAISLLITTATLQLYVDVSRNNDELARTNSLIENGRFTLQLLQQDIVHAGFWGGYIPEFDDLAFEDPPTDAPDAQPGPCDAWPDPASAQYTNNHIGIAVQSYNGVPTGCTAVVSDRKTDTDVLVVRYADTCVAGVAGCPDDADELYFQMSFCEDDPARYVLDDDAASFTLHTREIPAGETSCNVAAATLAGRRRYISNLYYIRNFLVTRGDGIPTLMRSSFDLAGGNLQAQAAQPLIEGVEFLRVELGVDSLSETDAAVQHDTAITWADPDFKDAATNRGDGVPDGNFVRCPAAGCTLAELRNVVVVKLYVLVRNLQTTPGYSDQKTYNLGADTVGPFNDGFKRHVFTSTVRLNNVSGRRETP